MQQLSVFIDYIITLTFVLFDEMKAISDNRK